MDALAEWLRAHLPPDPTVPSVVHGDFKLDNIMIDPEDVGRIVAKEIGARREREDAVQRREPPELARHVVRRRRQRSERRPPNHHVDRAEAD